MKILIVAATEKEIKPLLNQLKGSRLKPDVLITGVGMVATAFSLAKTLTQKKYDLAINLGICGSFNRKLSIGQVVNVTEDIFSELGAEDGPDFLKLFDMKLAEKSAVFLKPVKKISLPSLKEFTKVKAVTVNTVHGNTKSISKVISAFGADIESMEGAAFFYACNKFKIPALQLRAVSNYVERRNAKSWNIPLAVKNLNAAALKVLTQV